MKTRTDLLNHLAEKYQLKRYLEIGVQVPEINFDKIKCSYKVGVDPDPKALASLCVTSDQFFKNPRLYLTDSQDDILEPFDLIFIDGLHTAEQVKKDFESALKILSPNGFIVLHDCNPEKEEHTIVPRPTKTGHWNGDVYKFSIRLVEYPVVYYTIDVDNGCAVITQNPDDFIYDFFTRKPITWEYFNAHRKQLLNLISWDEFVAIGSHI